MSMKMAENGHISIGRLGEDIAFEYLENRGFVTIDRNYRRQWGELDIVAKKDGVLHFVEVKATGSHRTGTHAPRDSYRPEDHVHRPKRERLGRALATWLLEHNIPQDADWTVDVVTVRIDLVSRKARVRVIANVLLD